MPARRRAPNWQSNSDLIRVRWFGLGSSEASVQTLTTAVPNYAGGLPLIAAVFGPTDTIFVALAIATASIVLSPLTLAILEFNNAAANGQQNFGVVLGGATARQWRTGDLGHCGGGCAFLRKVFGTKTF